jgi:YD repeat-containing protein
MSQGIDETFYTVTFDSLNRIQAVLAVDGTTTTYTYQGDGFVPCGAEEEPHQPADAGLDIAFDEIDRIRSISSKDGNVTTYVYDGDGFRLGSAVTSTDECSD